MSAEEKILTKKDVRSVARNQRLICVSFLGFYVALFLSIGAGSLQLQFSEAEPIFKLLGVVQTCLMITQAPLIIAVFICSYKLAASMKEPRPWLIVIGMLLPGINLLVLVYLIQKAAKFLRANNIRVGIMGYNREDLNNYLSGNWERK